MALASSREAATDAAAARALPWAHWLAFVALVASVVALVVLPFFFVHNTYMSENALMPGHARSSFGEDDVDALLSAEDGLWRSVVPSVDAGDLTVDALETAASSLLRMPFHHQAFSIPHPFVPGVLPPVYNGTNLYGVWRAPRGDAKESVLLMVSYKRRPGSQRPTRSSLEVVLSLGRNLQQAKWLARDLVVVFLDDGFGHEEAAARAFLSAYHGTDDGVEAEPLVVHAGVILAALGVDIEQDDFDSVRIRLHGTNGQLPNLDLTNTIVRVARTSRINAFLYRFMLPVIPKDVHEWMKDNVGEWKDVHRLYYSTMVQFLGDMVLARPTGPHGVCLRYQIDAVTVEGIKTGHGGKSSWNTQMGRFGKTIQHTIRSLSNALEHLHQSFHLYILFSQAHYTSYGEYIYVLVACCACLYILGTQNYFMAGRHARTSYAVGMFLAFHVVGLIALLMLSQSGRLALLVTGQANGRIATQVFVAVVGITAVVVPVVASKLLPSSPGQVVSAVDGASVLTLSLPPSDSTNDWMMLKGFALIETGLAIFCLSLVNFGYALLVGMFVAVVYGPVRPFHHARLSGGGRCCGPLSYLWSAVALAVVIVSNPIVATLAGSWLALGSPWTLGTALLTSHAALPTVLLPVECMLLLPVNLTFLWLLVVPGARVTLPDDGVKED